MTNEQLVEKIFSEEECDHDGHVVNGACDKCGATGLESDNETYSKEAPR